MGAREGVPSCGGRPRLRPVISYEADGNVAVTLGRIAYGLKHVVHPNVGAVRSPAEGGMASRTDGASAGAGHTGRSIRRARQGRGSLAQDKKAPARLAGPVVPRDGRAYPQPDVTRRPRRPVSVPT